MIHSCCFFRSPKDAAANRFTRHEVKNGLLAAIGLSDSLSEMHEEHRRKKTTTTTMPTQQSLLGLTHHQHQESSATVATPSVVGNDSSLSVSSTLYSPPPYSLEPAQPTDSTSDQDDVMAAWISELDTTLTDTLNTVRVCHPQKHPPLSTTLQYKH